MIEDRHRRCRTLWALIVTCLLSFTAHSPIVTGDDPPLRPGKIVDPVPAAGHPGQSYALYVPPAYTPERPAPILYCFEPRSRGRLCLDLFHEAAERFGYLIASSNNSRSDGPVEPNLEAMKAMWKDTHARLAIDDRRVYATGFSGGARLATLMGRVLGITGVIAVGAGFASSAPPDHTVPFDFFAMLGDRDFNYYELRRLDELLDDLGIPHRVDVFEGRHQWAPSALCSKAIEWMELRAIQRGLRRDNAQFAIQLWARWMDEAREIENGGDLHAAWRLYRALATEFDGLTQVGEARLAAERLGRHRTVKREVKQRRRWDAWAAEYLDRLARTLGGLRDTSRPAPGLDRLLVDLELQRLLSVAEKNPDSERGLAAMRVLEMVLVETSFTQARHFLAAEDYVRAALCLDVAVLIQPDNATAWYNLACSRARLGEPTRALEALGRALDAGFADAKLMRSDPDLASLRDHQEFRGLLARLSP